MAKNKKQVTLVSLLILGLQQTLFIGQQKMKVLPKFQKKAASDRLKEHIEREIEETEQHIDRDKEALTKLEAPVVAKRDACFDVAGLTDALKTDENLRDAAVIAALQRLAHYQIANYGTLATWADLLGKDEVSDLIKESLDETKTFDETMTEVAESEINVEALQNKEEPAEA